MSHSAHSGQLHRISSKVKKTLYELRRMLSSVTLNCQVNKVVMNSDSQLSVSVSVNTLGLLSIFKIKDDRFSGANYIIIAASCRTEY